MFLSHRHEDRRIADKVERWAEQGRLGPVEIVRETEDLRQNGRTAVRKMLAGKLQEAEQMIVLAGADSHNSNWVDYEVNNAKSAGKPVHVVRIPDTTGAAPGTVRGQPEGVLEPGAIARELERSTTKKPPR
ncbi:MAG: TIR domain-containing protein [Myxococcales bacterium]|nr:TIR domain-containing protein [Myxococcales bacterium]MCB9715780.1 TIR domain-containing protein [Myxococcales bacterium]